MTVKGDLKNEYGQVIDRTARCIEQMQKGDTEAFNELYRLTNSYVQYTVRRQIGENDDWEDVVQEVYMTVFRQYSTVKNSQASFSWIKQIAFRKACDYNRKKYRMNQTIDTSYDIGEAAGIADETIPMPEDILEDAETQQMIRRAVDALSVLQRNALIGYYYNEMKVREIAEAMGIPEGTVMTALHRGRKSLRARIEEYEKKHGGRLLALPGAGLFLSLMLAETKAEAAALPMVQKAVAELAAGIISGGAAAAGSASGAAAGGAAGAGGAAAGTAGGLAVTKALPIAIAVIVAAGGIGGGVQLHHARTTDKQIEQIREEQEEVRKERQAPEEEIPEELTQAAGEAGYAGKDDSGSRKEEKGVNHMLSVLARYGTITEPVAVQLDDAGMIRIAACSFPPEKDADLYLQGRDTDGIPADADDVLDEAEAIFGYRPDIKALPDVSSPEWGAVLYDEAGSGAGVLTAARDGKGLRLSPSYRDLTDVSFEVTDTKTLPDGGIRVSVSCLMKTEADDPGSSYTMQVRMRKDADSAYGYIVEKLRYEMERAD